VRLSVGLEIGGHHRDLESALAGIAVTGETQEVEACLAK